MKHLYVSENWLHFVPLRGNFSKWTVDFLENAVKTTIEKGQNVEKLPICLHGYQQLLFELQLPYISIHTNGTKI